MVSLRLKSLKPLVTNTPFLRQEILSLIRGLQREKYSVMCRDLTVLGRMDFLCMTIKWFWLCNSGSNFISFTIWQISISLFNQVQNSALKKIQTDYFINQGTSLVEYSCLLRDTLQDTKQENYQSLCDKHLYTNTVVHTKKFKGSFHPPHI